MKAQSGGGSFISPAEASMPSSTGRSYVVPPLRVSAGARFTVMRETGKRSPTFFMTARTRSRASFTAVSGRPTMLNSGSPCAVEHSTSTS